MALSDALSKDRLAACRRVARLGQYQLLLGAGASKGAVNAFGALPMAPGLVHNLREQFPKAPISDSDPLHRAYQRAVTAYKPPPVRAYLKKLFGGARHEEWFQGVVTFPWARVWTLNIDDTFENAFTVAPQELKGRFLRSLNFDEPYLQSSDLQIIHLHGHVARPDSSPIVFSFSEYSSSLSTRAVWSQVLAGTVTTQPMVVIGARVLDDPDVEALLLGNPPFAGAPSFFVDPFVDESSRWELERAGYVVVKESAHAFIDEFKELTALHDDAISALRVAQEISIPQLARLETSRAAPRPRTHDFFAGDEPIWQDVLENLPADFNWIEGLVGRLRTWIDEESSSAHLEVVYAARLSGGTTGLMSIARSLAPDCFLYLFDRSSRFDVSTLLRLAVEHSPMVVLVDGASDFADDIDQSLNAALNEGVKVCFCVFDTPYNDLRLEGRITGAYSQSVNRVPNVVSGSDATKLVKKLEAFGRLGALEGSDDRQRRQHFAGRDVFSSMLEVEYATGFRRRLDSELSAVPEWALPLLLLLSFAARGGRDVTITDASVALGTRSATLISDLENDEHVSALVAILGERIVARQRDAYLDAVVTRLGADASLAVLVAIIENLAPLSTRPSLQQRNRAPLLVGHLMSSRALTRLFPDADLNPFYESLRTTFGDWNARYWEQRAIFAKSLPDWARAESYAARAVQVYGDAFTLTTYGTILINKCESLVRSAESDVLATFYRRGSEQFKLAEVEDYGNRVTRFAFLTATVSLLEALIDNRHTDLAHEVADDWTTEYAGLRISLAAQDDGLSSIGRAEALSTRFETVAARLRGLEGQA